MDGRRARAEAVGWEPALPVYLGLRDGRGVRPWAEDRAFEGARFQEGLTLGKRLLNNVLLAN